LGTSVPNVFPLHSHYVPNLFSKMFPIVPSIFCPILFGSGSTSMYIIFKGAVCFYFGAKEAYLEASMSGSVPCSISIVLVVGQSNGYF
jgi:hypothetical protein